MLYIHNSNISVHNKKCSIMFIKVLTIFNIEKLTRKICLSSFKDQNMSYQCGYCFADHLLLVILVMGREWGDGALYLPSFLNVPPPHIF
jgi:hypothetical protein